MVEKGESVPVWVLGLWLCVALPACKRERADPIAAKAQLEHAMAGAQLGEEREVDPGTFMTMFRSQATSPLADGWQAAASTKGEFTVELPLPFNDFRMRSRATDGVEIVVDVIGAKSPGLLSWMASCSRRADGKLDPQVQGATDKIEPLGTPVRAWQRTMPVDGRICIAIVEAQGTDPLPPDADIQRFLRSFHAR